MCSASPLKLETLYDEESKESFRVRKEKAEEEDMNENRVLHIPYRSTGYSDIARELQNSPPFKVFFLLLVFVQALVVGIEVDRNGPPSHLVRHPPVLNACPVHRQLL